MSEELVREVAARARLDFGTVQNVLCAAAAVEREREGAAC